MKSANSADTHSVEGINVKQVHAERDVLICADTRRGFKVPYHKLPVCIKDGNRKGKEEWTDGRGAGVRKEGRRMEEGRKG